MSKLGTAATLQRFQSLEQRLQAAGIYSGPIDDDWAEGVDAAIDQLFQKPGFKAPATNVTHTVDDLVAWPSSYSWLNRWTLPRLIAAAGHLLGTKETPGADSNPVIMGWKDELKNIGKDVAGYTSDAVPWCGLGMGKIALDAGYRDEIPAAPALGAELGRFRRRRQPSHASARSLRSSAMAAATSGSTSPRTRSPITCSAATSRTWSRSYGSRNPDSTRRANRRIKYVPRARGRSSSPQAAYSPRTKGKNYANARHARRLLRRRHRLRDHWCHGSQ
jgi:hypothetical protein